MVPKLIILFYRAIESFRAVLFRMVPKHPKSELLPWLSFRAVLFRMVPKLN